ncbi:unnamed protein product [Mytilus edulis]|uniref:Uncharacterized protein n=1 Tax=Mytilus edulis TaxID=6550 RepID=A0A8S3TBB7_MYTED|nr:unnamed protein product [Mytilus edulis]
MSSLRKSSVEDEYWDTSRASAKKNKAFNLFDDTVSVETADDLRKSKRLLRSFDDDDDESTDTINWDGTPSAETGAGNVSFQPDSGSMLYSKSQEKLSTSLSNTSLNNQSIHDVVISNQPKTPQTNDPKKLVEQIQFLQRQLERAKASGGSKIPVDETVQRIINGEV